MTLDELLERLADFEPTGFPFISLYLNAEPDQHGRDNFSAFVRKEFANIAKTYPPTSAERQSFDRDAERVIEYLDKEVAPEANGLAIFACTAADDFFEAVQTAAPIPNNRLYVYEQPHLYPLARLMDQYPRYAVLVANTNSARIYVFGRGKTITSEQLQGKKTNRTKVGGWSQMRYQRHLENYHLQHAKEVIEALEKIVSEDKAEQVILAGEETIIQLLREQMPQQLDGKVIDVLSLDINTPEQEILRLTTEMVRERDSETDAEKVASLIDEYRAGGLAVLGVEETLAALSGGQADELFIHASPGQISYSEEEVGKVVEAYSPSGPADLDTSEPRAVADELIRSAQATSARVTFIEDKDLLAEFGGVGATLRYKV
jgi:peptide chain release factor subunit 1